ncbi:hypothetical protein N2152v2_009390 [Parachlorella kessleri]
MVALDVEQVRWLAQEFGWYEVQCNYESYVIGFKRGNDRVNVYYTTGTIGTCLNHPIRGKTQLFRRNQSMNNLRKIFQDPRVHTGVGYYRRHSLQLAEPSQQASLAGICCQLGSDELEEQLMSGWNNKTSTTLALGSGYCVVERNGRAWWAGVPWELSNALLGRQAYQPLVDYVALGPDDSYFVQFTDGDWEHAGPSSMREALCEAFDDGIGVQLLAFTPNDGWYVLWEDGTSSWEGLPAGLQDILDERPDSLPGVEQLATGPNGEWFVRFLDGTWEMDEISDECASAADELQADGFAILSIMFGEDCSCDVPLGLYNTLTGRHPSLPPVEYVALGPDDSYFVQFTDGDWELAGPSSLYEALCEATNQGVSVQLLAFAPDDGWYVLWEDGASSWEGLPRQLHNKLNGRQKSLPGVEQLAIGPSGEWFVRFLNGDWRMDGHSDECASAADELQADGYAILSVMFGDDWSWCIQYG